MQQLPKLRAELRIAGHQHVTLAEQKIVSQVIQIPGHLLHTGVVGIRRPAGELTRTGPTPLYQFVHGGKTHQGDVTGCGDWRVKRTHFGVEMGPTWGWFDHVG